MSLRRIVLALISFLLAAQAFAADVDDIQQLLRTRQYKAAIERADSTLAKGSKDAQIRFLRGIALTELGRTDEAIKAFTALTEDYPQLPEPYNNLAVLYAQQNQLEKSRAALIAAIQTNPSYAIAHENLGDLYARMASQAYDKALQLDSANQPAPAKLALVRDLFINNPAVIPHAPATKVAISTPAKSMPAPVVTAKPTQAPTPAIVASTKPTATPVAPAQTATPKPAVVAVLTPATGKPAAKASTPATAKPASSASVPTLATRKPVATPASKPVIAKTAAPHDADHAQITAAVNAWAAAWSKQNVNGYLAAYAHNFKTPGGAKFADWAKERRDRITSPKSIDVGVSSVKIEFTDNGQAKVKFRQNYKSDRLTARSTGKTLIMEKSGSRWLIVEERT